jgi:hypothetical protein
MFEKEIEKNQNFGLNWLFDLGRILIYSGLNFDRILVYSG